MATWMATKRFELCLSAHDLARKLDISTLEVCDIEKGTKQVPPDLQLKIAGALNIDQKLLFDEDGFANFMED